MSYSSDQPLLSNQLPVSIDFPAPESPEFLNMLSIIYKRTVASMNLKEGSLYPLQETASFIQYFRYSDPATFTPDPNNFRSGYRTTFDLVALNGGVAIPVGNTVLALTATTTPPLINGILIPTRGYGAATIAGPIYVFFGTDFFVRFNNTVPGAQTLRVTNNAGAALTQAYFVMEYLKT